MTSSFLTVALINFSYVTLNLRLAGPGGKPTAFVVKPKQTEVIEALPLPLKNIPPKGVAVKVKESTSPKVTPVNREPIGPKLDKDKIQKKRKEKTQRTITVMSGKDVKLQVTLTTTYSLLIKLI